MKSIFSKLFIGFIAILLAFSIIISILAYNSIKNYNIEIFKKDLSNLNTILEESIKQYLVNRDSTGLKHYINENGKKINVRLTIIGRDGNVLADSKANADTMENHLNRPEIQQALKERHNGSSAR
jgi:two-component system phosphate regulon sensor histidine kinase PhoR